MVKQQLRVQNNPIMTVTQAALAEQRLVYFLLVDNESHNKWLQYKHNRWSTIAYIGTTGNGLARIAESAAKQAPIILDRHGVTSMTVKTVNSKGLKGIKLWEKLEDAMLLGFRKIYGELPICNKKGPKSSEHNVEKYFNIGRVEKVIKKIGDHWEP